MSLSHFKLMGNRICGATGTIGTLDDNLPLDDHPFQYYPSSHLLNFRDESLFYNFILLLQLWDNPNDQRLETSLLICITNGG